MSLFRVSPTQRVLNTALLLAADWIAGLFTPLTLVIDNLISAFLGALVISVVNFIVTRFVDANRISKNLTKGG